MNKYFRMIEATILLLSCIIHLSIGQNAEDAGNMFKYVKCEFDHSIIII